MMTGCANKSEFTHCQVYQTNIDEIKPNSSYFLSNENNIYLVGSKGDIKNSRTYEIFVWHLKIGNNKNWSLLVDGIPGECRAVSQTEDYIYLISVQHGDKYGNPAFDDHKLYRIFKETGAVAELYKWDEGSSLVRSIYFISSKKGYIFFRPSNNPLDYQVLWTINGGKEWFIQDLNRPVVSTNLDNDKFYFLSYKNNNGYHWLYSFGGKFSLDSIYFNLSIADFSVEAKGDYWLLGQKGEETVLQHYKEGKTTLVKTFSNDPDVFPDRLYKYKDLIVVLTGKVDENMLFGFGGTKTAIFVSQNNGKTWDKLSLEGLIYFNPISFYKDERMTAYSLKGRILRCQFKK